MDKQRHKLYNRYARLKSFGAYEYSVFYVLRFTLHSFRKGSDAQIQKSPLLLIIEERGF